MSLFVSTTTFSFLPSYYIKFVKFIVPIPPETLYAGAGVDLGGDILISITSVVIILFHISIKSLIFIIFNSLGVIVEKIYIGANSPTVTELVAKVVEILI
jgi:hypothetical protein